MSTRGVLMAHQSSKLRASITPFSVESPTEVVDIRDPVDTNPSDIQPPGVDEEPQSLEEALAG